MVLKTAVIIAGGKGERLQEHRSDLPKPMIPIKGIPLLERIIRWLKEQGVEKIVIGVAHKKEIIKDYFKDGRNFGVKIIYTEHDPNGGTEDAFKTAIEKSKIDDENFYAMNGDQITDLHLGGVTNFHIKNEAIATIVSVTLKTNFGLVEKNDRSQIIKFREKGRVPEKIINSGIYVFNKKIKNFLKRGNIEKNAFNKLIEKGKIYSFYYDGVWLTVNDKKELDVAEEFLSKFGHIIN